MSTKIDADGGYIHDPKMHIRDPYPKYNWQHLITFSLAATQTPEITLTSFTYHKTLVTFDENFYHVES